MALSIVTGLTAERMLEIEAESVVSGAVISDQLILTTKDGTQINAGNVRGLKGDPGPSVVTGTMLNYPGDTPPVGFLKCTGQNVQRAAYGPLFAAIGTKFGAADSTHFYLPDSTGWRGVSVSTAPIPSGVWTTVNGYTTDTGFTSDENKYYNYNNTNGVFTFITPWDFNVLAAVTIDGSVSAGRVILRLWKNGATEILRTEVGKNTSQITYSLNKTETFKAGDTLEVQVYQNLQSSLNLLNFPPHILELRPVGMGSIIKT